MDSLEKKGEKGTRLTQFLKPNTYSNSPPHAPEPIVLNPWGGNSNIVPLFCGISVFLIDSMDIRYTTKRGSCRFRVENHVAKHDSALILAKYDESAPLREMSCQY